MEPTNPKTKESFFAYVTRLTVITTAICLGGLFLGLPDPIDKWAQTALNYAVVTWCVFVGIPFAAQYGWKNRRSIKAFAQEVKHKGENVVQAASEVAAGLSVTPDQHNKQPDVEEHVQRKNMQQYVELPEPLNYLPTNPKPTPGGTYTLENAGSFVRDTVQLAGLKMDDIPEILRLNSGPTLQAITFQLPPGLQLSHLSRRRDDLANHSGMMQGFSVESSEFPSAATFIVPQEKRAFVYMRDVASSFVQFAQTAELPFIMGKDTKGLPILIDLAKLPHLLVAGATGSGKSVFINTLLESLLSVRSPEQLKLLLIDPKQVELNMYNGMPHLLHPTVKDPKQASLSLMKICVEMDRRYEKFSELGVRNILQYNKNYPDQILTYIVVVIDEYADLMMVASGDVEDAVVRLAQLGRACGIHLVLGTQRPSVDVVTPIIKANLPSRVAFRLPSVHDYRTILEGGNRSLLGKGDGVCLMEDGKMTRFQSAAISGRDDEMNEYIEITKRYWNNRTKPGTFKSNEPVDQMILEVDDDDSRESESEVKIIPHVTQESNQILPEQRTIHVDQINPNPSKEATEEEEYEEPVDHVPAETEEVKAEVSLWDDNYQFEEADEYDRFVSVIQRHRGFSMAIVTEHLRMELSQAGKYVERMRRENLLGSYDDTLKLHPWIGDGHQPGDSGEELLLDTIKEYICRFRSTRTMEIRDYLNIRKEKVLQMMKLLVEEGFLDSPSSPKSGYTILWDEDQIQKYLAGKDSE